MKNLIIDIGNSFAKIALFNNGQMLFFERCTHEDLLSQIQKQTYQHCIVSDVSKSTADQLKLAGIDFLSMSNHLNFPFQIAYETPQTLGVDRIAAIAGVWRINPQRASLVIDAGTCITYDFITATGVYEGGSISLGLKMRFRALHEQTGRLPYLELMSERPHLIGRTTFSAIQSGVVNGYLAEIEQIISAYKKLYGEKISVYICGGDASFIKQQINEIHHISELVMMGLDSILGNNL